MGYEPDQKPSGEKPDGNIGARASARAKVSLKPQGKRRVAALARPWVATALAELHAEKYSTKARLAALEAVVEQVLTATNGPGVFVFSGGWFDAGTAHPKQLVTATSNAIAGCLAEEAAEREVVVCVGVDGREGRDQLGVAVSAAGTVAIGRKFYPTEEEEDWITAAPNWRHGEDPYERVFEVAGKKFFISVCYDVFGVKHDELPNPGVNAMLGLIHSFKPLGQGGSGEVLYARHGFAGAAKQWDVPVFGAVKFRDRVIPEKWPSGVAWNLGNQSTTSFTYDDNPLKPARTCETSMPSGRIVSRIFQM